MYTPDRVREAAIRQEGHDEGFRKGSRQAHAAAQQQKAIKENKNKGANLAPGAAGGRTDINKARRDYHEGRTNVFPG